MSSSRRDQRAGTTLTVRISAGRGSREGAEVSDRETNDHDRETPSRHDRKKHREKLKHKKEKKERKRREEKKKKDSSKKRKAKASDSEDEEYKSGSGSESDSGDEIAIENVERRDDSNKKKKRRDGHDQRPRPVAQIRPASEEYNSAEDSEGSLKNFIVEDEEYDQSAEEEEQEMMYGYYSEGSWGESDEEEEQRDPDQDLRLNHDDYIATRVQHLRRRGHHVNLLDQEGLDPLDVSLLEVEVSINQREAQRRRRAAMQARDAVVPPSSAPAAPSSSSKRKKTEAPPAGPKLVPDPWRGGEEPDRTKEEEQNGVPLCVICQSASAKCIFVPCGQKCICVTCSQNYNKFFAAGKVQCPTCKKDSDMIIRVYGE